MVKVHRRVDTLRRRVDTLSLDVTVEFNRFLISQYMYLCGQQVPCLSA